ncbi:MAG: hypothetical protein HC845_04810 [Akkermansiaceae bacterium]|nr:hypothetical protein [Akkermansiaceae bacterium]
MNKNIILSGLAILNVILFGANFFFTDFAETKQQVIAEQGSKAHELEQTRLSMIKKKNDSGERTRREMVRNNHSSLREESLDKSKEADSQLKENQIPPHLVARVKALKLSHREQFEAFMNEVSRINQAVDSEKNYPKYVNDIVALGIYDIRKIAPRLGFKKDEEQLIIQETNAYLDYIKKQKYAFHETYQKLLNTSEGLDILEQIFSKGDKQQPLVDIHQLAIQELKKVQTSIQQVTITKVC